MRVGWPYIHDHSERRGVVTQLAALGVRQVVPGIVRAVPVHRARTRPPRRFSPLQLNGQPLSLKLFKFYQRYTSKLLKDHLGDAQNAPSSSENDSE